MFLDFVFSTWKESEAAPAIIWKQQSYDCGWLLKRCNFWMERIVAERVELGSVVILEADFSPDSIALFVALAERGCTLVPLTESLAAKKQAFIETAQGEVSFKIDQSDSVVVKRLPNKVSHPLYDELRRRAHPGLVLFSSGSTGESKAAVHDLVSILEKFTVRRQALRTIPFLLYDHIGGVNTMLHTLANGGCLVTVRERSPDEVLRAVETHRVELLPTSPTFLNLVLISEAYKRHDLTSLKTITYGTEPMPEHTLRRLHQLLPHVRLQQTYGLSEVGILRSKSKDSTSLWVKLGGEGFETKVVDGVLHIKARSAMLGYLNAPSPFTSDGWLNTGDTVEVDGDYIRILGRKSEIINVGGEKVYPAEVESVIQELEGVAEATVYGEKNPITGNIVCADVTPTALIGEAEKKQFLAAVRRHCRMKLRAYQVPLRVNLVNEKPHTDRFKKIRR